MSEMYRQDMLNRAAQLEYEAADMKCYPAVVYHPRLSIDGNQWCALYGENLQDGVAGFGESPALAMADFNHNWEKRL